MKAENENLLAELKRRGEVLYIANLRRIFSRRKNKDGSYVYQAMLDRIQKLEEELNGKDAK